MAVEDIDPDNPHHRIRSALSQHHESARHLIDTPEPLFDLLAYCNHNAAFFQGVIDRAAHRGFDLTAMMHDAIDAEEQAECNAQAAYIGRQFRLAPFRKAIDAHVAAWRKANLPSCCSVQPWTGRQMVKLRRQLEEFALMNGRLPKEVLA